MIFQSPLINARVPYSLENPWSFALTFFYQIYGITTSASFNVSTDTFASAMITQANGQVQRLGIELKKVSNFRQQKRSINSFKCMHTQIGYKAKDEKDEMDFTLLKAHSTVVVKQLERNIVSENGVLCNHFKFFQFLSAE